MINNVVLVGRLTRDPELKITPSNTPVVNFTIAVNRSFTNQAGEREADFVNCVVWNRQAENLARFMRQGSLIGVEGRIQTRSYETEQGTRYVTEVFANSIQFLETKSEGQQRETSQPKSYDNSNDEYYETSKKLVAEEDLPF
ncbi:MAG TPA: single-stranded DNA-binding protein [Acholeplasmataceae bacterium]|nr:single-stranded DNA-binding protein [Acholeplasmataceae bacterium]